MEIKTKYSIGDVVYFLDNYRIQRANIVSIIADVVGECTNVTYRFAVFPMKREIHCFSTKEELINNLK